MMKYHIQEDHPNREKNMNTLMKYIQIGITDMKEKVMQRSISNV